MLTVEQALHLVLERAKRLPIEAVPLSPAALGLVLAEDIATDLDMPPYDKSLVDGYAVRTADWGADDELVLEVIEEIAAGQTPRQSVRANQAARIMTGAMVPLGADAIVMIERTQLLDGRRVRVQERPGKAGQNILPRGREMRAGDRVLSAGTPLRPQELGLLATVGKISVPVYRRPVVVILSTGDEVVEPSAVPGPGQIRNSNAAMLSAQVVRAGGSDRYLGIARDSLESLRPLVVDGLRADVFLLSGGVSAGKLDLVPGVLQGQGVEPIFHRVEMKPGKPLFFGVKGNTLVFGLPGNPVSSLVGFELFVRPALRRLLGHAEVGPKFRTARMAIDYAYRTDRPTYHPARLADSAEGWQVTPVPWFGSPDLRAIAQASAFVLFAVGDGRYRQGEMARVLDPEG